MIWGEGSVKVFELPNISICNDHCVIKNVEVSFVLRNNICRMMKSAIIASGCSKFSKNDSPITFLSKTVWLFQGRFLSLE